MKRMLAAVLIIGVVALATGCSAIDFKDRDAAIEKALMKSGLDIASASAQSSNDGTAINFALGISSNTYDFTAEDLRTVLEIVLKDTPRAHDLWIKVTDPQGEWINLEPAYLELGFPTQMELYIADHGPVNEAKGTPVEPRAFEFGRNYTEKTLNK